MTPSPFPRYSLLVATLLLAGHLSAETHYVAVDDSGFSPAVLNINVGDTVVWVNNDEDDFPHTATSNLSPAHPDYWDVFLVSFEESGQNTFNNPGAFTYQDKFTSITGTITVSAVATPEINLENPRIEAGQFLVDVSGLTIGKTNVLEFTTNLVQWTGLSTNVATVSSMTFTNQITLGPNLFRVHEMP